MLIPSERWREYYPGAVAGAVTVYGVSDQPGRDDLRGFLRSLELRLKERHGSGHGDELSRRVRAYAAYYRRFGKTYHVLLQYRSVAQEGKPIRSSLPLVEAMFAAELDSLILTAGHDLDLVKPPVVVDVSAGDERYVTLRGEERTLKKGDMFMRDGEGVISSVIYGPDRRTMLHPLSRNALFCAYAPEGVGEDAVRSHLEALARNVLLLCPNARVAGTWVCAA